MESLKAAVLKEAPPSRPMAAPRELRSEIDIGAPAERVWEVLTDFEALPEWNPFLIRASGRLVEGERIEVVLQPPGEEGHNVPADSRARPASS